MRTGGSGSASWHDLEQEANTQSVEDSPAHNLVARTMRVQLESGTCQEPHRVRERIQGTVVGTVSHLGSLHTSNIRLRSCQSRLQNRRLRSRRDLPSRDDSWKSFWPCTPWNPGQQPSAMTCCNTHHTAHRGEDRTNATLEAVDFGWRATRVLAS